MSEENVTSLPADAASEKLVHLALPVRLTHMANGGRGDLEMACTYDIHPNGARLLSFRDVKVGDMVTVERGRNKSTCQVVWTADPNSALRGQFTVQCMEGHRIPWEEELRQMQENYFPLGGNGSARRPVSVTRQGEQNRRRSPRFPVRGGAELVEVAGKSRVEARLQQLSEFGCQITAAAPFLPGTNVRMVLSIYDVSVAVKGNVKYAAENRSMGVEFHEIRQGDRPLLDYVLNQLKQPRRTDFADLAVVTEPLAAIAG